MAASLGQPVIIENKPGASTIIGNDAVAKAAPDGYTLLFGFSGPLAIVPNLNPNTPYDPLTDLVPIAQVATAPYVLLVHPSVPARNVKQLVGLAKARPGKMNFSSGGNGTGIHMAGELFASLTVEANPLPARSKISRSFFSFSSTVFPSIKELICERWET